MFFSNTLIAGAFAAVAYAQSSVLTFTGVPNPITAGQPQAITYATNDTESPVTILLRQGAATNLQTVATLTDSASDGQFIWTPSTDLPNGNDYALQIEQDDQINYFGPFTLQGSNPDAEASSSSSSSSITSVAGSMTILPIPYPIATSAVSDMPDTLVTGSMTTALTGTANGTTYVAPIGTGSVGTGMSMPRNTTMSMPTLTASTSTSTEVTATATEDAEATEDADLQGGEPTDEPEASEGRAAGFKAEGALALVIGAAAFFL